MSSSFIHLLGWVFYLALLLGALLMFLPASVDLGDFNIYPEVARSFPHLTLGVFIFGVFLGLLFLRRGVKSCALLVLVSGLAAFVCGSDTYRFYTNRAPERRISAHSISLLLANVEFGRGSIEIFHTILSRVQPDLVFISEATEPWIAKAELGKIYPHRMEIPGRRAEGCAFYSRFPLKSVQPFFLAGHGFAGVRARIGDDEGKEIEFFGIHAPAPHGDRTLVLAQRYFQEFTRVLEELRGRKVLIAGDFNMTPFSHLYKEFTIRHSLSNSFQGLGWQTSWILPSMPLFRALIDYALVGPGLEAESSTVLETIGSDHLPVVVRVGYS